MNIAKIFENAPDVEVESIMSDSRVMSEKAIFFCIKGMVNDGHDHVDQAIGNGAIVIVHCDELKQYQPGITYIQVTDTQGSLNEFTAAFYGDVTAKMTVFGFTGTNGKTTSSWVTRYLVSQYEKCGYIGTIGYMYDQAIHSTPLTTPDVAYLHRVFREMYDNGCSSVAMEVSSAGLELRRVESVKFDYVVFSNLTHDHLDLHGNFENYYNAKKKLFTMVNKQQSAIINIDDEYGARLMNESNATNVSYAIYKEADYRAVNVHIYADHTTFDVLHNGETVSIDTNLCAEFNVYNLLSVLAMLNEAGYPMENLAPYCKTIPHVLGRVEIINEGQPFNVVVDYAHTPDGFEKIFAYAKNITDDAHRIIVVFGAAGGRDTRKRPVLGEISAKYCDVIIVTSEDPRKEDPAQIANEIQSGITSGLSYYIEDRGQAIRQAIELANKDDTVLILGKGDEDYFYMPTGRVDYPGDQNIAIEVIKELYGE